MNYIPTNSVQGFLLLYILTNICYLFVVVVVNSHANRCDIISHCGFDFQCPHNLWCWTPFCVPMAICMSFWVNVSSGLFCIFLKKISLLNFFATEFLEFLIYFGNEPFLRYMICKHLKKSWKQQEKKWRGNNNAINNWLLNSREEDGGRHIQSAERKPASQDFCMQKDYLSNMRLKERQSLREFIASRFAL